MATFNFTTGPATLPDVGELSYNGCTFSPLFATDVSCNFVKDAASRSVKEIEYTIKADGYVTLPDGAVDVQDAVATLERLLSTPAGTLRYTGRGIKIEVNTGRDDRDVAWGPMPDILEITPMGSGRSAHIVWTVKARVAPKLRAGRTRPVLQFSYSSGVSYDDAGYCTQRIAGSVEIPLTRSTTTSRTIDRTADQFRESFPGGLLATIDLRRFRVTKRNFTTSKDKRTLEFDVEAEELPWMAMPPMVTIARGQYSFKPSKAGVGLCNWLCTLSVTYTVPKGQPRRIAWLAFLALLRERMTRGNNFGVVPPPNGEQNPGFVARAMLNIIAPPLAVVRDLVGNVLGNAPAQPSNRKVWLIDFSGTEGLYLDSKTVTFSATWRLVTVFSEILRASGLWRRVPGHTENVWAISVQNISGYKSWLDVRANPADDAIVDFGY